MLNFGMMDLQSLMLTWEVFPLAKIAQFLGEESFEKLIENVVICKGSPGQSLQTYCFANLEKLISLNSNFQNKN